MISEIERVKKLVELDGETVSELPQRIRYMLADANWPIEHIRQVSEEFYQYYTPRHSTTRDAEWMSMCRDVRGYLGIS